MRRRAILSTFSLLLLVGACGQSAQERKLAEEAAAQKIADEHKKASEFGKENALKVIELEKEKILTEQYKSINLSKSRASLELLDACKEGKYVAAKVWIDFGADVNTTTAYGYTPLIFASGSESGNVKLVNLLIEKGADVNAQEHYSGPGGGTTALMNAAYNGNLEVAKLLLEKGADIRHAENNSGETVRKYAALSPVKNTDLFNLIDSVARTPEQVKNK